MRFLKIVVGAVAGGFAGAVCGAAATMIITVLAVWTHPNDPSAGSAAIIAIALVPAGLFFGAGIGASLVADWTRKR